MSFIFSWSIVPNFHKFILWQKQLKSPVNGNDKKVSFGDTFEEMISISVEDTDKKVKPKKRKSNNYPMPNDNITTMNFKSRKISLIILGAMAILCSRTLFFFFDDTEGPNLLIVGGLAIAIYFLSLMAYVYIPSKIQELKKLSIIVCVQILSVIGVYFCTK